MNKLRLRPLLEAAWPTEWWGRVPGNGWRWAAYAAFAAQVLLFTRFQGAAGPYWGPVLFGVSGGLLSVFALLFFRRQPLALPRARARQQARRLPWGGLLLLLGAGWVLKYQAPVILGNPVNVAYSDVIPILQNYVARFRSGEVVYKYITNLPYPLFPNHLPWQWLPYVLPDAWGLDYRWWGLGLLLLLGFGAWQVVLARQPIGKAEYVFKALLPAFLLVSIIRHDAGIFSQVVEPTIIAYYCLLAASVLSRSVLVQAAALVLCLLSRYSVVFWVPLLGVVLWFEAGWRHTLRVAGLVLAGVLAFYVVPFLSKDWTIFTHALSEYRLATLGEWGHNLNGNGQPYHVFNGLGMAAWFYTYAPGDLSNKISWLQRAHVVLSAGTALGFGLLYWRWRGQLNYRYFLLVALQAYLLVFYLFLQIPYSYLISLTVFMSAFVVLALHGPAVGAARPVGPAVRS